VESPGFVDVLPFGGRKIHETGELDVPPVRPRKATESGKLLISHERPSSSRFSWYIESKSGRGPLTETGNVGALEVEPWTSPRFVLARLPWR
jgi:hypothetical protein